MQQATRNKILNDLRSTIKGDMLIIDGRGARRSQNTLSDILVPFLASLPSSRSLRKLQEVVCVAACPPTCVGAVRLQHGPGMRPALDEAPAQSSVPGEAPATRLQRECFVVP